MGSGIVQAADWLRANFLSGQYKAYFSVVGPFYDTKVRFKPGEPALKQYQAMTVRGRTVRAIDVYFTKRERAVLFKLACGGTQ